MHLIDVQGPNQERQDKLLATDVINRLGDWIHSCAVLTKHSVRRLTNAMPTVGYLSGNLYSRLKAVNTDFSANLDADPCWHILQVLGDLEASSLVLLSASLDNNDDALNELAEAIQPQLLISQFKMHWAAITFDRKEHLKRYTHDDEDVGLQPLRSDSYLSRLRNLLEAVSDEVSKSFRIESLSLTEAEKEIYTRLWATQDASQ